MVVFVSPSLIISSPAAQDSPDAIDVSLVDSTPLGVYVYHYLCMGSDLHFLKQCRMGWPEA